MKKTDELDSVGCQGAGGPARRGGSGPGRLGGVYESMAKVTAGLAGLPLTPFSDDELWGAAAELARLQQAKERQLVTVVAEIEARGLSCPGGLSRVDWLRAEDPSLGAAQAKAIVTVALAHRETRWAELTTRVRAGTITVPKAAQVITFRERLHLVAEPAALDAAVDDLTDKAATHPAEHLARWVRHHTETITPPKDIDGLAPLGAPPADCGSTSRAPTAWSPAGSRSIPRAPPSSRPRSTRSPHPVPSCRPWVRPRSATHARLPRGVPMPCSR